MIDPVALRVPGPKALTHDTLVPLSVACARKVPVL